MTEQPPISDSQIVAETFQAIRVREIKTVEEVKALMAEQFPDIDEGRRHECLVKLADILVQANAELFDRPKKRTRQP